MLIRFEATNFRSILDPVELTMVAIDDDRPAARPAPNLGESLLTVAAIYGPNASGKSNLVAAMTWLRDAVWDSLRFWDDGIPAEPFAFAPGNSRPTRFTVESLIDGVRFEYSVEFDAENVHYEGLFHYPQKKRRLLFERIGPKLELQRGLGRLSGTRTLLTPRALALSIARRFDEPTVGSFTRDLLAGQTLGQRSAPRRVREDRPSPRSTASWLRSSDDAGRPQALALLQLADLGIDDVVWEERERNVDLGTGIELHEEGRMFFVHRAGSERIRFTPATESAGTRTWFALIGPVLAALRTGSLLLFDELDASLHPTLSTQLIKLFQDPEINPLGAQLIFTSHDTSLLNHLNRDEVWLTEKIGGMTRLGALAEFTGERVRRSVNLEKAYLGGRFGALPDSDRTGLLRALGLIG